MSEVVEFTVDRRTVRSAAGVSLAAALLNAGTDAFRASIDGSPRGPVCGMGVCFECRVTIDDVPHQRACMVPVRAGMAVITRDHT